MTLVEDLRTASSMYRFNLLAKSYVQEVNSKFRFVEYARDEHETKDFIGNEYKHIEASYAQLPATSFVDLMEGQIVGKRLISWAIQPRCEAERNGRFKVTAKFKCY